MPLSVTPNSLNDWDFSLRAKHLPNALDSEANHRFTSSDDDGNTLSYIHHSFKNFRFKVKISAIRIFTES